MTDKQKEWAMLAIKFSRSILWTCAGVGTISALVWIILEPHEPIWLSRFAFTVICLGFLCASYILEENMPK